MSFGGFDGSSVGIKGANWGRQKLCTCQLFIQSVLQATQASVYLT